MSRARVPELPGPGRGLDRGVLAPFPGSVRGHLPVCVPCRSLQTALATNAGSPTPAFPCAWERHPPVSLGTNRRGPPEPVGGMESQPPSTCLVLFKHHEERGFSQGHRCACNSLLNIKKKCFHVRIPDSMRVESKEAILDSSSIMCSVDTNRHRCNVQ